MSASPAGARVVCISGGTSGIGAALVRAFLAAGDRVYAFARRPEGVARLAEDHAEASGRLTALAGDVTDEAFRAGLMSRIGEERGRLDVLINNAGIIRGSGYLEETLEDWRATLEVNLVAPFALTRAAAPLLQRAADPCVINLSSACAQHPYTTCTSTSYSVSKAGLDMLTLRLALGLGPQGIRVNALAPGVVPTEIWGAGRCRPGRRYRRPAARARGQARGGRRCGPRGTLSGVGPHRDRYGAEGRCRIHPRLRPA